MRVLYLQTFSLNVRFNQSLTSGTVYFETKPTFLLLPVSRTPGVLTNLVNAWTYTVAVASVVIKKPQCDIDTTRNTETRARLALFIDKIL